MTSKRRPARSAAEKAIEEWLDKHAPGYPTFSMCEDGDDDSAEGACGWAFWIAPQDTTSYLHEDLSVEWYGTGWPDYYEEDQDTGTWHEKEETPNAEFSGFARFLRGVRWNDGFGVLRAPTFGEDDETRHPSTT